MVIYMYLRLDHIDYNFFLTFCCQLCHRTYHMTDFNLMINYY